MISSVIGAVIMSAATVAMLSTLQFTNKVTKEVGKDYLTLDEQKILRDAYWNNLSDLSKINEAIKTLDFAN